MARRPKWGSSIDGLLLLNKAQGVSSNQALQQVKRLFNANRAGHTGALDPLATGMLPICFGEATKFTRFLLDSDKSYRVTAQLGIATDSGDSDGKIMVETAASHITQPQLEAVIAKFIGNILQVPPQYSALKHRGKPLYHYARQGIVVAKPARPITIKNITLVEFLAGQQPNFTLEVDCSKGTYIRSLVEDIGVALGSGACVVALHRTKVSCFTSDMQSYQQLEKIAEQGSDCLLQQLYAVDEAVKQLPKVQLSDCDAAKLRLGQSVSMLAYQLSIDCTEPEQLMRCYENSGKFIGVVKRVQQKAIKPFRLVAEK